MNDSDDIDALAGEYVLGTLEPAERASVAARREREPALDAAITQWERRLAPLDEAAPEIEPPAGLFARIETAITNAESSTSACVPVGANVADLSRRLRRWRLATFATGAIAAALAFVVFLPNMPWKAQPSNFVAVLQRDPASPAFVVEVNLTSKMLTVRRVAAEQQAGKSYELWMIHNSLGAPKSMGVIADQGFTMRPIMAGYDPAMVESATFAVTLEPAGGSPTGAPTSAPLWTGKLVQASP